MLKNIFLLSLISSYLFFGYHQIFLGLSFGAALIIIGSFYQLLKKGTTSKFLFYNLIVATVFVILFILINPSLIFDKILSFFWVIIIFYFFHKTSLNNGYNVVKNIYLGVIFTSLIFSVGQSLNIDIFWNIRDFYPTINDEMINSQISLRTDPPGLAYYNVQLSSQVSSAIILYNLIISENLSWKKGIYVNLFFIVACFLTSMTSSLVIALSMILIRLFLSSKSILKIFIFLVISSIIIFLYFNIFNILDGTKLSRLTFTFIGILVIASYPFGVPIDSLYNVKNEILRTVFGDLPLLEYILETSFHNSFINVGVEIGLIGLLIYVFIYFKNIGLIQNLLITKSQKTAVFLIILVYSIQFVTHNSGPYTGDPYYWIALAIYIGGLKNKSKLIKIS